MSEIVWEDPPAKVRNPGKWDLVAADLRANPKRWARIADFDDTCPGQLKNPAQGLAATIKAGRDAFAPKGAFEAAVRHERVNGDKNHQIGYVYARFVGDGGES